jgi:hypothetical protein
MNTDWMMMSPRLRRFVLTTHVTTSVGWLGAVASFLALAIAGLTSRETQMVRAAYLAMELTGWFVIVPLSLASPLTGLVQSLGSTWGLFRHYWVLVKFLITIPATVLLLVHMRPIGHLARVVEETTLAGGELAGLRLQLVADAGAALVVLLAATVLSVYKPRGLTPYGKRIGAHGDTAVGVQSQETTRIPRWLYVLGICLVTLLLVFVVIKHLTGGGAGGHAM